MKSTNNIYFLIFVVFASAMHSCNIFREESREGIPVARVYDSYLYDVQVHRNVTGGLTGADSINAASKYIKNWIERQLLVRNAERNLGSEKETIQKRLEEYRNDLLIYNYQSRLVSQKLDTVVSEKELKEYYEENKENFRLRDYIVRLVYVKLDSDAPNLNQVRNFMHMPSGENLAKLEEYCIQFAANFYLEPNKWLYVDDLLKEVPLSFDSRKGLVKTRELIEFEESGFIFLLKITDGLEKGEMSPLAFERENIKNMILNKRKVQFLHQLKKDVYLDAENQNNFEIY